MGDREHCRICHKSNGKLLQPCKCRGTISSVHASCIKEWIVKTSTLRCSVCRSPFVVTRVYDKNASRADAAHDEDELTSTFRALCVVVRYYASVWCEYAGRGVFFVVVWLMWAPTFLSFMWAVLFSFDDVWSAFEGVLVARPPRLGGPATASSRYDFHAPSTVYLPGLVLTIVGWGLLIVLATWWAYCQENGRILEDLLPALAVPGQGNGTDGGAAQRDWAKEVLLDGSESSSSKSSSDSGSDVEVPAAVDRSAIAESDIGSGPDRLLGSGADIRSTADEALRETAALASPPRSGHSRRPPAADRRPLPVDIVNERDLPSMIQTLSRRERLRHAVGLHDNTINALEHFGLQGSLYDATILAVTFIVVFVPASVMVLLVVPLWIGRQLGAGILSIADVAIAWELLPQWMTAAWFVTAHAITGHSISTLFPLSLSVGSEYPNTFSGPQDGDVMLLGVADVAKAGAASSSLGGAPSLSSTNSSSSVEEGGYVAIAFIAWAVGLIVVAGVLRIVARLTRPDEVRRCFAYTAALLRVVVATVTHMVVLPAVYALVIALVCSEFLVSSSAAHRFETPQNVSFPLNGVYCSRQSCDAAERQLPPLSVAVHSLGRRSGGAGPALAVFEASSRRLLPAASLLDVIQAWRQRERCSTCCWDHTLAQNASLNGSGGDGYREPSALFVLEGYEARPEDAPSSAASALRFLGSLRPYGEGPENASCRSSDSYSASWRSIHALLYTVVHLPVFSDLYTWLPLYLTGFAVSTVQWTCWYHVRRLCHPAMFSWLFRNPVETPLVVQFVSLSGPLVLLHALRNVALTIVSGAVVLRPALLLLSSVFPGATPVFFSWSSGNPVVDGLSANLLIFGGRMVRFIAIVGGQPLEEEVLFRRFAMLADFLRDVHETVFERLGSNLSLLPFLRFGVPPRPQNDFFFPLRLALLVAVYVSVAIGLVFCAFLPGVAGSYAFTWGPSGGASFADGSESRAPIHSFHLLSYLVSMITSPEAMMLVRSVVLEERLPADPTESDYRHSPYVGSGGSQQSRPQRLYPPLTVHSLIIGWSLVLVAYQLYDVLLPYLTHTVESVRRASPSLRSVRFALVELYVASSTVGTVRLRRVQREVVPATPLPPQSRGAAVWEVELGRFQNPLRFDPSAQDSPAEWLLPEQELVQRLAAAVNYVGVLQRDAAVTDATATVESVLRDACAHVQKHRPLQGDGLAVRWSSASPGPRVTRLTDAEGSLLRQALAEGAREHSLGIFLSVASYLFVLGTGFGVLPILVGNGMQRLFTTGTIRASTQELLLSPDALPGFLQLDVGRMAASWCLGALMLATLWGAWRRTLPRLTRRLVDFWRFGMLHANVLARTGAAHVLRVLGCGLWLTAGLACLPHSASRGLSAATAWHRSHTSTLRQQPDAVGELEVLMLHFGLVEWVVTALWMVMTSVMGDRIPMLAVPFTSSWVDEVRRAAAARLVEAEAFAKSADEGAAGAAASPAQDGEHHQPDDRLAGASGARRPDPSDALLFHHVGTLAPAAPQEQRAAAGGEHQMTKDLETSTTSKDDPREHSFREAVRRRLAQIARAVKQQNRDDVHLVDFRVHPSCAFRDVAGAEGEVAIE